MHYKTCVEVLHFIDNMEKQEAKELIKAITSLDKTIAAQTKEYAQFNRKLDTLNENFTRLCDKLGTQIQLMQNK